MAKPGWLYELAGIARDVAAPHFDLVGAGQDGVHFTQGQFSDVAAKARQSLLAGGRFAFIVGLGDGREWSNGKMDAPRFFC